MLNQDGDLNIQSFRNQIPKPMNITDDTISLDNDMLFGWTPKLDQSKLLTLNFNTQLNDQIILEASQNKKLIYVGFRPQDNNQMHKQYSSLSSYPFKRATTIPNKPQFPFLGMNPTYFNRIKFNSIFESGNLDIVIQVSEFEYDLYMRVDGNTQGHTSWYNFELSGLNQGEKIQLNICNFTKSHRLYERGMKPYIWRSTTQEWLQGGDNIQYKQFQNNNCLSFCIECNKENELLKIAYCVPYTFSQLLEYCDNLEKRCNYVKRKIFCESLGGVQLPMLIFNKGKSTSKKCLILQARIHPGESNGSWVMQGVLDFLSSQSALKLFEKCVIKVVPMMNPDGVILGNYRTGLAGKDLNRKFKQTDGIRFPTVQAMKRLVYDQYKKYGSNLIAFIDLHGHSIKKNVFLYGPEYTLQNYNYYKCRILPKLLSQRTEMFRFYSSIFRISSNKRSTARGVFAQLYDIVNCFTIETSNGNYYNQTQTFDFTSKHWLDMGRIIGETLIDMINIQNEMDQIYNTKSDELSRSYRSTKNQYYLKKKSIIDPCQISFQNTKFSKLLEELKNDADKMIQSCSEGNSDSLDDDENEEEVIEHQSQEIMKPKSKSKSNTSKYFITLSPGQKSKLDQKCSSKPFSQQTKMHSVESHQNKTQQLCQSPTPQINLKKLVSRSQSKKKIEINKYITNYVNQQFDYIDLLENPSNLNQSIQQKIYDLIPRPSTSQLEGLDEETFIPIKGLNSYNQSESKRHSRLHSYLTVNKQKKHRNTTKSPPKYTQEQCSIQFYNHEFKTSGEPLTGTNQEI
ncbi:unnamed protein product (macronuclear) [Paramecium tetraurelia]|uniref:Peptidase M14 domain-containing protein n=1 Tax=Paramecium tetraurelia TaxID=5888 RepID=A0BS84_PARTE|nr:uncharacterized protein GSPATT00031632001 [Paramecium tetraurelia]CAK61401.1 unnamed protein product [Paramecium tetraurelia]|eukprot:XP_001428799.1 hypothetical protein (macronuclear) [Paramecium tetraurelia strain d4-2]